MPSPPGLPSAPCEYTSTFTTQPISTTANSARSVFAADVDNDGDLDVLSASSTDDKIAWYENDGSENFTTQIISTTAVGATSVYAAEAPAFLTAKK